MEKDLSFLQASLEMCRRETEEGIHCAVPGRIVSYDPDAGKATVQPGLARKTETGAILTAPELQEVPVLLPAVDYAPQPGDPCILLFMDFCLDGWLESGQPVLPPSPRRHDWSDAVALAGYFPAARR